MFLLAIPSLLESKQIKRVFGDAAPILTIVLGVVAHRLLHLGGRGELLDYGIGIHPMAVSGPIGFAKSSFPQSFLDREAVLQLRD